MSRAYVSRNPVIVLLQVFNIQLLLEKCASTTHAMADISIRYNACPFATGSGYGSLYVSDPSPYNWLTRLDL